MQKGLLGKKLTHSFSKIIHENLMDYQYNLFEKEEDQLEKFFEEKNFDAINVTVPYKKTVMKYMDYIDEKCQLIGATNTVVNKNNKLYGYNTDYYGFKYMLEKNKVNLDDKKVCILGNGGAAQAIKAVVKDYRVKQTIICKKRVSDETITYDDLYQNHQDIEVLINTSYVGMYPNNFEELIDLNKFNKLEWIIDIIYNPLNTKLLVDAKNKKLNTLNGLEMLVAQAVYAMEYFNDIKLDKQIIDDYYQKLLKKQRNIVLIGMPSCGKTTIGKKLQKALNKECIDIDTQIEKIIKMSIKKYFIKFNELNFREHETAVVKDISKLNGYIISTGGGVVLKKENMDALKQNGLIIYIKRDLNKLQSTSDRPLSKDDEAVKELYESRYKLYQEYADIVVDNNGKLKNTIKDILEKIEDK
jgi:shikimate dehydrogenase